MLPLLADTSVKDPTRSEPKGSANFSFDIRWLFGAWCLFVDLLCAKFGDLGHGWGKICLFVAWNVIFVMNFEPYLMHCALCCADVLGPCAF